MHKNHQLFVQYFLPFAHLLQHHLKYTLGYDPIKPTLKTIEGLKNAKDVMDFVGRQLTENNTLLFQYNVGADEKNSSVNVLVFSQGGLGMPDRDYYLKTDAATTIIQQKYQTYIQDILKLVGTDSVTATKQMMAIYNLEKLLAISHKTNVELRDPQSNYNKKSIANLQKIMPVFDWVGLTKTLGVTVDSVNISQPVFYAKVNELLTTSFKIS